VVVANYFHDKIVANATVIIQPSIGTTTDAILAARDVLQDEFIVINGDVISDVGAMVRSTTPSVAVSPSGHGDGVFVDCGLVKEIGSIRTGLYNVGMYRLHRSMLGDIASNGLLSTLVGLRPVEVDEVHHINTPADALDANEALVEHYISPTATILPGVYIEPPVHIGEHSVVGPNSYLRPGTSVGANCRIGQSVEIKNSIIMDNTKIPHLSYVGDSIIGEGCNLGAGTICSNLRLDGNPVCGRRKFGVVMRDGYKTMASTVFMPGTVL
jgi:bifunctional UDP-N-acetylglucosamine pyrophosphorylase/glucosamine-1-phosphate N-acetyltransferase